MTKPLPKSLFLVKSGTMSKDDIKRAELMTGVCIVECEEPGSARFLVPPPTADITLQADAAMKVLTWIAGLSNQQVWRSEITAYFTKLLCQPSPQAVKRVTAE